jgi:GntR family transcriptional repressor for pyruvate dehydrogenase complex
MLQKERQMPFRKRQSQNKREYVTSQILESIQSGEFKAGDRLPSENSLAEMMGVSRPSVREALSALRLLGFIDTKDGYGTYVKSSIPVPDKFSYPEGMPAKFDSNFNIFEMLEARKVFEPAVARFALSMVTDEGIAKLEAVFQKMTEAASDPDYDRYHQENLKFHRTIAAAAKNNVMLNIIESINIVFVQSEMGAELRRRYLTDETYRWRSLETHRSILESIRQKDPDRLEKSFAEHFEQVDRQLIGM